MYGYTFKSKTGKKQVGVGKIRELLAGDSLRKRYDYTRRYLMVSRKISMRSALVVIAIVVASTSLLNIRPKHSRAAAGEYSSSGKGVMVYGEGNTTPKKRTWASKATSFGSEGSTVSSRNPLQTVVKNSPVKVNEYAAAIADNAGNVEVLLSTDGGSTWSISLSAATIGSIGGTGTTRRFDIEYEHDSGDLLFVYSKNATTNELASRLYTGSWSGETTYDPGGTSSVVTWVEMASQVAGNEIAVGYLTNATATANIGGIIWDGSTNALGNATTAGQAGMCDQTNATPNGVDKCYDVNYEWNSGRPVITWGIQSAGNTTNTIRNIRWNGTTWTLTTLNVGTGSEDGTMIDCESKPDKTSNEIGCGAVGNGSDDSMGWTEIAGAIGVGQASMDTTVHTDSAGRMFIAATYIKNSGNYRLIVAYADAAADATGLALDYYTFNGSAWAAATLTNTLSYTTQEENIQAITSTSDFSSALFIIADASSDLYVARFSLSGTTLSLAAADGGAALEASLPGLNGTPVGMDFEKPAGAPTYAQQGYIWENDDGSTVDGSSQLAAGNTAITEVQAGQRIKLRTQLTNSGDRPSSTLEYGLFYDRNDNNWSRVENTAVANTASGSCTDTTWSCDTVYDPSKDVGQYSDIAIDPATGDKWIAFFNATDNTLMAARYVGSGGNCLSAQWACETVNDPTATVGSYLSIGITTSSTIWISYYNISTADMSYARRVGTGGTGCTGSTAWSCTLLENQTSGSGPYSALAFDTNQKPVVMYYQTANGRLMMARYDGAVGSSTGCDDTTWRCRVIDDGTAIGLYSSVAVANDGTIWAAYFDQDNGRLKVVHSTSANSGCTGGTDTLTNWTCEVVDAPASTVTGQYTSIAIDRNGNPWITYYDSTNGKLRLAQYTGTGGTGCSNATNSTQWACSDLDDPSSTDTGKHSSIAFGIDGNPRVSYYDTTNTQLKYAVCSGDAADADAINCNASVQAANSEWSATAVDNTGSDAVGEYSSLAFTEQGQPMISYYDGGTESALKVAYMTKSGEITMGRSVLSNGGSVTASHADMTTATDSSNRSDADCIASATWGNGIATNQMGVTGLVVNAGASTAACTEIAWILDTSQAVAGTTYRFLVATRDAWRPDQGPWRAMTSIAQTPSLTVSIVTEDKVAKSTFMDFANCTDTNWGCESIKSPGGAGDKQGRYMSMALDPNSNNPWFAWYAESNAALYVARYVGSGGSCTNTAWACSVVDETSANVGTHTSMAFDGKGVAWVTYRDVTNTSLRVARYVGGGNGNCTDTDWVCYSLDGTADVGQSTSLAISPNGTPAVAYRHFTNDAVRYAMYVGSGGSGCTSSEWSCETVVDDGLINGERLELAFSPNGTPYIAYHDWGSGTGHIHIARKSGDSSASSCTGATYNTAWVCDDIADSGGNFWATTSIGFDASGNPRVAFYNVTSKSLKVAKYTGTGSETTCGTSPTVRTNWYCETVDQVGATKGVGQMNHIAFDQSGAPWISYLDYDNGDLKYAHYVGSGGSGCTSSTNANTWTCSVIDNAVYTPSSVDGDNDPNRYPILFDRLGTPWIGYASNATDYVAKVAKLHVPPGKLSSTNQFAYSTRSANSADGMYRMDDGRNPLSSAQGTCNTLNANRTGMCGVYANEGYYDSLVGSNANEQPMYTLSSRFDTNAELPTVRWVGKTSLAPNTASTAGDILVQVYRFGSTNTWETIASNTTSADCNTDNCTLTGTPAGTASEYFESSGGKYYVYFRIYQIKNSSAITFKTDEFEVKRTATRLRGGADFRGLIKRPGAR